jgi:hypothetical protein
MDVATHGECRSAAVRLNQALPKNHLVVLHSGNGSLNIQFEKAPVSVRFMG